MAHTREWIEGVPLDVDNAGYGANEMRTKWVDIKERMEIDHVWDISINDDGEHLSNRIEIIDNVTGTLNLNFSSPNARIKRINLATGAGTVTLNISSSGVPSLYARRFLLFIKQATSGTPVDIIFPSDSVWHNGFITNITANAGWTTVYEIIGIQISGVTKYIFTWLGDYNL